MGHQEGRAARETNLQTMAPKQSWLYAAACVVVPVLWGLAMVWVTNRIERSLFRRARGQKPGEAAPQPPPLEYHI